MAQIDVNKIVKEIIYNNSDLQLPEPSGTYNITANGTYNIKDYASVEVELPDVIIEVSTANEMNALLVEDNVGNVYRYVGTTDATYTNGSLYVVRGE